MVKKTPDDQASPNIDVISIELMQLVSEVALTKGIMRLLKAILAKQVFFAYGLY